MICLWLKQVFNTSLNWFLITQMSPTNLRDLIQFKNVIFRRKVKYYFMKVEYILSVPVFISCDFETNLSYSNFKCNLFARL